LPYTILLVRYELIIPYLYKKENLPLPVKTSLAMMKKIREEFRLPLCEMAPANRDMLKKVLKGLKLI
jgi:hypothetical protein